MRIFAYGLKFRGNGCDKLKFKGQYDTQSIV